MRNTGSTTWTSASQFRLGSQNGMNNTRWGFSRVELPGGTSVEPGQEAMFNFNVTAPATTGTHNFQWQMVHEGIWYFGGSSPNVAVQVGSDNAQFVSQEVPASMVPGATYPISITMKNTGSAWWAPSTTSLGSNNPVDNTTWGPSRVAVSDYVAPGANGTFTFNVTAPSTPGTYNFQWQVLKGDGRFGPATPNVAVNVNPDAAEFVAQSVPATMVPGRTYSVTVTMKNTGSSTWSAESLHALGSYNPQDNTTWGPSRVEVPGEVPPGASVAIPFNITAPSTAGTYNFQWRLAHGTTWFGPATTNVAVNVGSAGSPVAGMHFIHADHLSTPREIYDASQQLKWKWDQTEPFGNNVPDENPSALGAYEFNLRFPGQYADKETNLHYNYFRDYDPLVGRYVQSDPIGLVGGLNTYSYVNGSPLSLTDPQGLWWQQLLNPMVWGPPLIIAGTWWWMSQSSAPKQETPAPCDLCQLAGTHSPPPPDPCDLNPVDPACASKPTGNGRIALGIDENGSLDKFAQQMNAQPYGVWGSTNFRQQFISVMNNPGNTVYVNLTGVNPGASAQRAAAGTFVGRLPGQGYSVTDWELMMIRNNPRWWNRCVFMNNGSQVPNPFASPVR